MPALESSRARISSQEPSGWQTFLPYLGAMGIVTLAGIGTELIQPYGAQVTFPFFYLAIVVAAIYGHGRGAMLVLLVAAALAFFWFLPAEGSSRLLRVGLFLVVGGVLIALVARMRTGERKLKESEERFRQLAENIDGVFWLTNADGSRLFYLSPAYERIWGRSLQSTYTSPYSWLEAIHPEDRAAVLAETRSTGTHSSHDRTFRVVRPDGSIRWVRDRAFPVRSHSGEIIRVAGLAEDVTERREAEEAIRFQAGILNEVGQAIIATDAAGAVVYSNRHAQRLYGWTAAEMRGRNVLDIVVPAIALAEASGIMAQLQRGESWSGEFPVRRRDGSTFLAHVTDTPLHDAAGNLTAIIGISSDITERTELAEKFRESERRFSDMLAKVQLLSLMLDRHACIIYCNDYLLARTGWRRAEVIGRNWFDLFMPPESVSELRSVYGALLQDRPDAWHHENEIVTRTGERRLIRWNNSVLRDASGAIIGTASIGEDVTAAKRAEIFIKQFASIVESSDDAILSRTLNGVITSWNPAAEKMFGYKAGEMIGRSLIALIPEDRKHEEGAILRRIAAGERIHHFESVRVAKDGRALDISATISPILDAGGRVTGASTIARDITERKQTEEALRELSRRLLVAENQERGRIAKELHDSTAQSLVAVMMNLESLREVIAEREPRQARQIEDCLAILESATHEIRTLAYVLHPARLEEEGLVGALRHYASGFGERSGILTTVDLPVDFGRLPPDVELVFFRLVQEALGNVLRHAQAKAVAIGLRRRDGEVVLEVADNGRGLPDGGAAGSLRVGVGIAGMRERMRQIGGHLALESGPGGTTVRAVLPP